MGPPPNPLTTMPEHPVEPPPAKPPETAAEPPAAALPRRSSRRPCRCRPRRHRARACRPSAPWPGVGSMRANKTKQDAPNWAVRDRLLAWLAGPGLDASTPATSRGAEIREAVAALEAERAARNRRPEDLPDRPRLRRRRAARTGHAQGRAVGRPLLRRSRDSPTSRPGAAFRSRIERRRSSSFPRGPRRPPGRIHCRPSRTPAGNAGATTSSDTSSHCPRRSPPATTGSASRSATSSPTTSRPARRRSVVVK